MSFAPERTGRSNAGRDPLDGLPPEIKSCRVLSLKQAAALAGLSVFQYRRLINSGRLKVNVLQIGERKMGVRAGDAIRAHSEMVAA